MYVPAHCAVDGEMRELLRGHGALTWPRLLHKACSPPRCRSCTTRVSASTAPCLDMSCGTTISAVAKCLGEAMVIVRGQDACSRRRPTAGQPTPALPEDHNL